jgi:hypothetical protein
MSDEKQIEVSLYNVIQKHYVEQGIFTYVASFGLVGHSKGW